MVGGWGARLGCAAARLAGRPTLERNPVTLIPSLPIEGVMGAADSNLSTDAAFLPQAYTRTVWAVNGSGGA